MKAHWGFALFLLVTAAAPRLAFAQKAHSASAEIAQKGSSYLGIGVEDIDSDKAKSLKLKEERGALITSITPAGPAAKAGLKEGDVVMEYNGTPIQGTAQLQRMVSETPAGRQAKLVVSRNGALENITATIGERPVMSFALPAMPAMPPEMPRMPSMPAMPNMGTVPFFGQMGVLGIMGEGLGQEPQLAEFFGVQDGVLVKSVTRNSPAAKAGIKAGDVIVKIDDTAVSTTGDITMALRGAHGTKNVVVVRNKKEQSIPVTLEDTGHVRAELETPVYC